MKHHIVDRGIIESGIISGHPWTDHDNLLVSDLPAEYQEKILRWVKDNIIPRETLNTNKSSYGLKHVAENAIGIYVSNNQLKDAMLLCGYEPYNEDELNWYYCISQKSPALRSR